MKNCQLLCPFAMHTSTRLTTSARCRPRTQVTCVCPSRGSATDAQSTSAWGRVHAPSCHWHLLRLWGAAWRLLESARGSRAAQGSRCTLAVPLAPTYPHYSWTRYTCTENYAYIKQTYQRLLLIYECQMPQNAKCRTLFSFILGGNAEFLKGFKRLSPKE